MKLTLYIKRIFLFILLIDTIYLKPKGANLDSKKYPKLIQKFDYTIVLMYEEWCHFSQEAVKIFKQLMLDEDLKDTDIIFGFFDLKQEQEFKKLNSIKEIPEIYLYIKKTQIKYTGNIDKLEIKNFIIEKLQIDNIQHIDTLEELKQFDDIPYFLYHGQRDTPRYHLFLEGHYSFLKQKFLCSDNNLIGSKLGLKNNEIYFYNNQDKSFQKYKKAFKRQSFLSWITAIKRKNFFEINSNNFYNTIIKKKKPYLLIFADEDQKSQEQLQLVHDNQQNYFEHFQAVICMKQKKYCQEFINDLYFQPQFPSIYIMTFHKNVKQPLFYQYEPNPQQNFEQFIKNFQKGKRSYTIFSQEIDNKPDYSVNKESSIVTRNFFKDFLISNLDKDIVILFFNSKNQKAIKYLQQYKDLTYDILQNDQNKKNLSFGYFDISKNSSEVFQIEDNDALLIMYKQASLENQSRFIIDLDSQNYQDELINYLESRATHRLYLDNQITDEV